MAKSLFRRFPDKSLNGGMAFVEQSNGWTAHLLTDDFWEASVGGTLFPSGPHAAVAVGTTGATDLVTFVVSAVTSSVGVAARQLRIAAGAYAQVALGVPGRILNALPAPFAATSIGIAAGQQIATFIVTATGVATSIVQAITDFFPFSSGGGGGLARYAWQLINRVLRPAYFERPRQHLDDIQTEVTDANVQQAETRPSSPQI